MEGINKICSLIIFLYLLFIFLLNCYINRSRKKTKKYLVKLKDINQTINFYCYNLFKSRKLFWLSLLELIDKGCYSLKDFNNNLYIYHNNKSTQLNGYQLIVKNYIDSLLNEKEMTIDELDSISRRDINFARIIRLYMLELKKNAKEIIGNLDRINDYVIATLCTFLYSLQIIFFITDDISMPLKLLIAIPFTCLTVLFSDLLKNKIGVFTNKKYLLIFLCFMILSILTTNIWNDNMSNNYIIFHFVIGGLACMYPLLIIVNIYLIRSNSKYKNSIQAGLKEQMNNLSDGDDYIYLKVLNRKKYAKTNVLDNYFKILDL